MPINPVTLIKHQSHLAMLPIIFWRKNGGTKEGKSKPKASYIITAVVGML